jgi:hypothetical protein
MHTPGFVAEFSLYKTDRSYRPGTARPSLPTTSAVKPQKITCEEYECGGWSGGFPPTYCVRCSGDRLQ